METKADGGSKMNSLIGVGIIIYLVTVSIQSLIFSFTYAAYSLAATGVLACGEAPFLLSCGPAKFVAGLLTASVARPQAPFLLSCGPAKFVAGLLTASVKSVAYGVVAVGGVVCFVNISWNPMLLAGHLLIGFLAYRYWLAGHANPYAYEKVPLDNDI
mmetsp:Transcript_48947/g.126206  ORF Transcript_48947/g.126206 Transcript_48947/m.126206 type:complete len:158 (+) Transcript_48947:140-613(+)